MNGESDQWVQALGVVLHGMITGDLVIEAGATATIHGTVNGVVRNQGGHVEIWGVVDDIIGPATVKDGAIIKNQRQR